MAMTNEEYIKILRYFQKQLQRFSPDIFEQITVVSNENIPTKNVLTDYLENALEIMRTQSSSSYPKVLRLLNENIQTENGEGINSVKIEFTEQESQIYGMREFDLYNLPDNSTLIRDLSNILEIIRSEPDFNRL